MDPARDSRARARPDLIGRVRRWLRPPRALRPTRAGWVFFALTFGVGFAALNTGNNLLYLVLSLMLAFLVLSGVLSESALRGVGVRRRLPREIYAGRPAVVALEITNAQRRVPSFAIAVEDRVHDADEAAGSRAAGRTFALRIGPGCTERRAYRFVAARRGPATFTRLRVSTRFPFGLFLKSLDLPALETALVYPALDAPDARDAISPGSQGGETALGGGRSGADVGGLRDFASGDSARRIQWRASFRRGALVVRDVESERDAEVEVRLRTRGRPAGAAFEAAVNRAATRCAAALEAGARVALRTDETLLEADAGAHQRARLLVFLARVQPTASEAGPGS